MTDSKIELFSLVNKGLNIFSNLHIDVVVTIYMQKTNPDRHGHSHVALSLTNSCSDPLDMKTTPGI